MEQIKSKLENLYEDLKGVLYRICHLQDDFEKNFFVKSEIEKQIKLVINEQLKTILADCYTSEECIYKIIIAESDEELKNIIQSISNEFRKSA